MWPTAFTIIFLTTRRTSQSGIHLGATPLSGGWPLMYFGKIHTPRRAATNSFCAIGFCDSSEAISIAELPMPTTSTRLPRMSCGSNGVR